MNLIRIHNIPDMEYDRCVYMLLVYNQVEGKKNTFAGFPVIIETSHEPWSIHDIIAFPLSVALSIKVKHKMKRQWWLAPGSMTKAQVFDSWE